MGFPGYVAKYATATIRIPIWVLTGFGVDDRIGEGLRSDVDGLRQRLTGLELAGGNFTGRGEQVFQSRGFLHCGVPCFCSLVLAQRRKLPLNLGCLGEQLLQRPSLCREASGNGWRALQRRMRAAPVVEAVIEGQHRFVVLPLL